MRQDGALHVVEPGQAVQGVHLKTLNLSNVVGATLSYRGSSGRKKQRRNLTAAQMNRTV